MPAKRRRPLHLALLRPRPLSDLIAPRTQSELKIRIRAAATDDRSMHASPSDPTPKHGSHNRPGQRRPIPIPIARIDHEVAVARSLKLRERNRHGVAPLLRTARRDHAGEQDARGVEGQITAVARGSP